MGGEGFLFGRETCLGGHSEFWWFWLHFWLFTVWVLHSTLCPPPNFPQRDDFKGLTRKLFRNMDLNSIFGLNSRFGGGLGRNYPSPQWLACAGCTASVYQRVTTGRGFTDLLEDGAPALPVRCHSRIWASCASVRVVTVQRDENSVVDKEFAACGSHVGMI